MSYEALRREGRIKSQSPSRKRHQAVYDATGRIALTEASQAVQFAAQYVEKIRKLVG